MILAPECQNVTETKKEREGISELTFGRHTIKSFGMYQSLGGLR